MSDVVAELRDLCFRYNERLVVDQANLDVYQDDFLGIIGPNGGGKTTILKLMLGLLKPDSGTIRVFGKTPAEARTRMGYVPQFSSFSIDFPVTVRELVLTGRLSHARIGRRYTQNDYRVVDGILEELALSAFRDRPAHALSGGERQRVLVARALACEPDMLLLDEPTANIDMNVERAFHDHLKRLNERIPIVLVSHDLGFIATYLSRVVLMSGSIRTLDAAQVHAHDVEDVYQEPVKQLRRDEDGLRS